jgi:hypothetical protein
MLSIIILVIFLIILISSNYYSYHIGQYNNYLSNLRGFWETDKLFNDESGIKIFTIYIGPCNNKEYPVYLLIVDTEDNILINNPTTMNLNYIKSCDSYYEFNAKFSNLDSDFLPNDMIVKYYPNSSKIILYNDNIIYGCLFKNLILSDIDLIKEELNNNKKSKKKLIT